MYFLPYYGDEDILVPGTKEVNVRVALDLIRWIRIQVVRDPELGQALLKLANNGDPESVKAVTEKIGPDATRMIERELDEGKNPSNLIRSIEICVTRSMDETEALLLRSPSREQDDSPAEESNLCNTVEMERNGNV